MTASNRAGDGVLGRRSGGARRAARRHTTPSRSSSTARATRRSRAATARSSGSRRPAPRGDATILDHPDGLERAWAALANPNAGELIVSAAAGWEFADLAGRHHAGGGSHGSLLAGDSEVPMLTVGIDALPGSITEVMPAILDHFGVALPAYARVPSRT